MGRTIIGALCLVGLLSGTARAEEDQYKRLTVTVNSLYLLVPLYMFSAEFAVDEKWSVALRGGGGTTNYFEVEHDVMELGAQGSYYVTGNVNRGVQLGLDARYVSFEGDGQLAGLGDGVALGPYVGYKRVFGSGFTLGAQLGAQVAIAGESEDPVLPYLALSAGFSMWDAGDAPAEKPARTTAPGDVEPPDLRGPLDFHEGLMFGISLGGGSAIAEGCDACDMQSGIAVDTSIGWFLHRRVAIMYDGTGLVGLSSNDLGSAGVTLQSFAVQYWPHEDWWLKVGVGAATRISASFVEDNIPSTGGGGTIAAGYEFHHDGRFNMDFQLRATHASFEPEDGGDFGINTFVGLVGANWY